MLSLTIWIYFWPVSTVHIPAQHGKPEILDKRGHTNLQKFDHIV